MIAVNYSIVLGDQSIISTVHSVSDMFTYLVNCSSGVL